MPRPAGPPRCAMAVDRGVLFDYGKPALAPRDAGLPWGGRVLLESGHPAFEKAEALQDPCMGLGALGCCGPPMFASAVKEVSGVCAPLVEVR